MKIDLSTKYTKEELNELNRLDKILKEYHDPKNETYKAALDKVKSYANEMINAYTTYWCKQIDEVYSKDTNKAQFINEWERKIQNTKVNDAAFNGSPNIYWSKVQYGGHPIYTITRKIEQQNSISELLINYEMGAVIGAYTLYGIEAHVIKLGNPQKTEQLTFKWIGKTPLEKVHAVINGTVLDIDLETTKILFGNKPVSHIKNKPKHLISKGFFGAFIILAIREGLIAESTNYQSIIQKTILNLETCNVSKEATKIVNTPTNKHYISNYDILNSLK